MLVSYLLARRFGGKKYVILSTIAITLISILSAFGWIKIEFSFERIYDVLILPIPLSFPFYALIFRSSGFWVNGVYNEYRIYFILLQVLRWGLNRDLSFLYFSFFLLINLVGAIIGYWIKITRKKKNQKKR